MVEENGREEKKVKGQKTAKSEEIKTEEKSDICSSRVFLPI